jgi:hypothetical protein
LLSKLAHLVHHIEIVVFRTCSLGSTNRHLRTTPDCSIAARRRSRHSGNA